MENNHFKKKRRKRKNIKQIKELSYFVRNFGPFVKYWNCFMKLFQLTPHTMNSPLMVPQQQGIKNCKLDDCFCFLLFFWIELFLLLLLLLSGVGFWANKWSNYPSSSFISLFCSFIFQSDNMKVYLFPYITIEAYKSSAFFLWLNFFLLQYSKNFTYFQT